MKKTIYFKNGSTLELDERLVDAIVDNLHQSGSKFQHFADKDNKLILIINTEEIVYIK